MKLIASILLCLLLGISVAEADSVQAYRQSKKPETGGISTWGIPAPSSFSSYGNALVDSYATISAAAFGAIFNGISHPLTQYFTNDAAGLAAAQSVFPFVTSLTQERDAVAVQAALNYCASTVSLGFSTAGVGGCNVVAPRGLGFQNFPIVNHSSLVGLVCGGGTRRGISPRFEGLGGGSTFNLLSSAQCVMQYDGPALTSSSSTVYMYEVSPVLNSLGEIENLFGDDIVGISFDCNQVPGCHGVLTRSVWSSDLFFTVNEPSPIIYTTTATCTNSQVITVSDTSHLNQGEPVTGAGIVPGNYVMKILSSTTFEMNQQCTSVANGQSIAIGGEGWRMDTAGVSSNRVSASAFNEVWVQGSNVKGAAGLTAPLFWLGATAGNAPGGGGGGCPGACGNINNNDFLYITCTYNQGGCIIAGDQDHNYYHRIGGFNISGSHITGADLLRAKCWGLPDDLNAGGRFMYIDQSNTAWARTVYEGSDTGGCPNTPVGKLPHDIVTHEYASAVPGFEWPIRGLGAGSKTRLDTGSSMGDSYEIYGGGEGCNFMSVTAPDGSNEGGNNRAACAFDGQLDRSDPTHIALGSRSALIGGTDNTITSNGGWGFIGGGFGNKIDGNFARAGGTVAFAAGYGWDCYSAGNFASSGNGGGQECKIQMRGTVSNGTVQLTSDAGAAGSTNCINMQLLSGQTGMAGTVDIIAHNASSGGNDIAWVAWPFLIDQTNIALHTFIVVGTKPSSMILGTAPAADAALAADTVNGCLKVTFTSPATADSWHALATVRVTMAR